MSSVTDILKQNGLEQYCEIFEQNKIDTTEIAMELTDADYLSMGISILGDRKKIMSLFAKPKPATAPQPAVYANNQPVNQMVVLPSGTGPLVLGLLGLFGGFIPIVQYFTGLLSILAIFIGASQSKKLKEAGLPSGKATAGMVLGIIAVFMTVIGIAVMAMFIGSIF
jgi:hypothetical protein